jgi:F-type H+-transporting ATPase subunit c
MKNTAKISMMIAATLLLSQSAFAQEAATATDWPKAFAFLTIGIAALGGGLGQSRIVAAFMEGVARNPQAQEKMFTPMILGLAFIESLVIFALIAKFVVG